MLTEEQRREKAHRYYVSTYGEQIGTKMWEDYCRKSGLLPEKEEAEKKEAVKKKKGPKANE